MIFLLLQTAYTAFTKHASSRNLSRAESIVDLPYFEESIDSEKRRREDLQFYSLKDIVHLVNLNPKSLEARLQGQSKQINDKFAGEFKRAVCSTVDPNFYVEVNVEIELLKQLPALSASSKERHDIVVYADGSKRNVLLTVEVRSSPMLWTERKAILGAANMVCLLRNTSDSVQKFTSFAFAFYLL